MAQKKTGTLSLENRCSLVQANHKELSIRRQCELLQLPRSTWYRGVEPAQETPENLEIMAQIDKQYLKTPFYGSRKMVEHLQQNSWTVNRKRIQRLMRIMGIEGIAPGPNTSNPHPGHKIYPYLLRNYLIERPNQVWSTDITYIPMPCGFMYLVAIIDWFSRFVLSWSLSNTMDTYFCIEALKAALNEGKPEIFNTDQGSQFTSHEFTHTLLEKDIQISMDGRGRALDNVFVERLWRSVKYECIYLNEYSSVNSLHQGLSDYFRFYNYERIHQSLNYKTPEKIHFGKKTT